MENTIFVVDSDGTRFTVLRATWESEYANADAYVIATDEDGQVFTIQKSKLKRITRDGKKLETVSVFYSSTKPANVPTIMYVDKDKWEDPQRYSIVAWEDSDFKTAVDEFSKEDLKEVISVKCDWYSSGPDARGMYVGTIPMPAPISPVHTSLENISKNIPKAKPELFRPAPAYSGCFDTLDAMVLQHIETWRQALRVQIAIAAASNGVHDKDWNDCLTDLQLVENCARSNAERASTPQAKTYTADEYNKLQKDNERLRSLLHEIIDVTDKFEPFND